ncbi:MAG: type II secretion system F family protein [Candidatus Andersenbacteria bacterium]
MPQYSYRAKTVDGKEVRGKLTAQSSDRADSLLRSHHLAPIEIVVAKEDVSLLNRTIFGGKVTTRDLILFSRQIASMIRAGVPVLQSLQALAKQVEKPSFHTLLQEMAYDIEGGESLSVSMSKRPEVFSLFFLGVVRTGEASGRLSQSLVIMADYLEQNYAFTRKVRSALMYPVFVLTAVVIVVFLMFTFVVPQLVAIFVEAAVELPLPTRILIAITNFMTSYWYIVIVLVVVLGLVLRSYLKTPEGQYNLSTWVLHIPGLSTLFKKVYLARLTSILHTLFSSDVPIIESLKIAQTSMGNKVYQNILANTASAIKDGASISTVWEQEPYIPPMLTTMVGVGERSGEIDKAFSEAHGYYKREVAEILENVTVFIEPILVIVLGIGVGIVVAAVLLPIYNLVLVL